MPNYLVVLGAALIPTIIGFIWYNPKTFGNAWMKAADMTDEKIKGGNMPLIFGVSLVLSVFLSFFLSTIFIHQGAAYSLLLADPANIDQAGYDTVMEIFGDRHRTFGHGFAHGMFMSVLCILPILGTNALFERKGWKYILVNVGYWALTVGLMGGIICQWA
ncbi:MAG: DUF1761 domain-containing protein [Flavobacteriales bacterium]|nr:DUF1761 domain-containing protein [Flavobacteriales bacterium]